MPRSIRVGAISVLLGVATLAQAQTVRPPAAEPPRDSTNPGSRVAGLFVYDSVADRLIVHGGNLNKRPPVREFVDVDPRTYAFDGSTWRIIASDGPRTRDEVAAVYDPRDGSILMVGGRGQSATREASRMLARVPFRETWRFAGSRWTLVDTTGPRAPMGPAGAFDARRGRFVVFGGRIQDVEGPDRFPAETWEWDGTRWTRFDAPGPLGRNGHVMAYDHASGRVVLHGGVNGVALTDTWSWDGARWQLHGMEGPRTLFGAATSHPDSGIVLFGGHTLGRGPARSTWHWSGREWRELATDGPAPRTFNMMTTDTRRRRIYMLGGIVAGGGPDKDAELWWLGADGRWTQVTPR